MLKPVCPETICALQPFPEVQGVLRNHAIQLIFLSFVQVIMFHHICALTLSPTIGAIFKIEDTNMFQVEKKNHYLITFINA